MLADVSLASSHCSAALTVTFHYTRVILTPSMLRLTHCKKMLKDGELETGENEVDFNVKSVQLGAYFQWLSFPLPQRAKSEQFRKMISN